MVGTTEKKKEKKKRKQNKTKGVLKEPGESSMKIRLAMENNEFNSIQLRCGQNGTKCSERVTRLYLLRKTEPMRVGLEQRGF